MRTIPALLLGLAVALAGCAGEDEGTDAPTPPTETTPTTPTDATPSTPANATPDENETEEEPTTPAPAEVFSGSFDFSSGDAQGGATQAQTFTVAEGYTSLLLNVTFTPTGVGVGNSPKVVILDPSGAAVTSCAASVPVTEAQECAMSGSIAAGGEYTIHAEGAGTLTGAATVTAV